MTILGKKISEGKEFIITCEFVPGRGCSGQAVEDVLRFGEKVVKSGLPVHALSITDNPGGCPAISPDSLAEELKKIGMESLVHFSCAGINRNTFESRASALSRKGLENLLVITGDFPVNGYHGKAKPVFDLDSVQAIHYLKEMNAGLELPGKKKDGSANTLPKSNFIIASGVTPFGKAEAEMFTQYLKLEKKIKAGVDFIITNLGFDIRKFAEVQKFLIANNFSPKVPLFGNCYALSRPVARMMNKGEVAGCVVTDELLKTIEQEATSADKGKQAKLDRAAKLTAIFRGLKFKGVHLGGFGLKFEDFEYIIGHSVELEPQWREFIPEFRFGKKSDFYLFPEDPELTFEQDKLIPVAMSRKTVFSPGFAISKITHWLWLTRGTPWFRLCGSVFRFLEKHPFLYRICNYYERIMKYILFKCEDCGDCALVTTGYLCPMSACAKNQRNGPCGGSRDGRCEVYSDRECIWVRVFKRLSGSGSLDSVRNYIPPQNYALVGTSSWGNYYLGKDHAGQVEEVSKSK
jgi:methylenetetrahydrofolate reductase (NADPH)